jgi:hypothetical protein
MMVVRVAELAVSVIMLESTTEVALCSAVSVALALSDVVVDDASAGVAVNPHASAASDTEVP